MPFLKLKGSDGNIYVAFEVKAFNLERMTRFAPSGIEDPPEAKTFGPNTAYYYGPGGGGVNYPDQFFFNVKGKTLRIQFDGPYNGKTVSEEAKQLESRVLETLRVF